MLGEQRQIIQHFRIHLMPCLQGKRLPFLCFGSRLCGHGIDLALLCQLQICLFIADSFDPGKQRHAVAAYTAEIAAVLVRQGIEAQMILSRPVVAAEGAARLDFLAPQRPGVEDEPAPPGRVHDGNFVINFAAQAGSPPSVYAACRTGSDTGRTCSSAPRTHLAMMTCPVGRTLARSSMDSILSTNTG